MFEFKLYIANATLDFGSNRNSLNFVVKKQSWILKAAAVDRICYARRPRGTSQKLSDVREVWALHVSSSFPRVAILPQ